MHWLFEYFWRFFKNFLCCFFQKQVSKDHLHKENNKDHLHKKTTLLNEKQSNLKKEMYGNSSLYCQYFHLGQEVMFTKYTFAF